MILLASAVVAENCHGLLCSFYSLLILDKEGGCESVRLFYYLAEIFISAKYFDQKAVYFVYHRKSFEKNIIP